jgi:stage II sporulation SpoAA-like protein
MAYDLSARKERNILWVRITGARTRDTVWTATQEIFEACRREGTPKVLLDVRGFEGRLAATDNYELPAKQFPELRPAGVVKAVAILDAPENLDRFALFVDAAQSRGFNLRVFGDIDSATKWLKKQPVQPDPPGRTPALHG